MTYGYYGKLPLAGDFLRRGLSEGFVAPWDSWLQAAMLHAQDAIGPEDWPPAYLSAPIWRFALAPGLCGPRGAAGILMPSTDRVGRLFPFTIAAETGLPPIAANLALQPVADRLETLALQMIEDGATLDALHDGLAKLPAPATIGSQLTTPDTGAIWVAAGLAQSRVIITPAMPTDPAALFPS